MYICTTNIINTENFYYFLLCIQKFKVAIRNFVVVFLLQLYLHYIYYQDVKHMFSYETPNVHTIRRPKYNSFILKQQYVNIIYLLV